MTHTPPDLSPAFPAEAWARLEATLCGLAAGKRFALAYSGGLDSRFLAHAGQRFGLEPLLLHVHGPHVAPEESASARAWARLRGLPFLETEADPLSLPEVAAGDRGRCYACKRELFGRLRELAADLPLCDGSNASDAGQYRPGLRAVRELGILSPLALAGFGKAEIRRCAAATGMENPDQRARPCLLTRLPYGMKPEKDVLAALAQGEEAVRRFLAATGWEEPEFRLRLVAPDRAELHVAAAKPLAPDMLEGLEKLLAADPRLPAPRVVTMETISGFFDRAGNAPS